MDIVLSVVRESAIIFEKLTEGKGEEQEKYRSQTGHRELGLVGTSPEDREIHLGAALPKSSHCFLRVDC